MGKNNLHNKINKYINEIKSYKFKHLLLYFLLLIIINYEENSIGNNLIKVAYYCNSFKYGGIERIFSILIKYLTKEKYFNISLITKEIKQKEEYSLPKGIKRIILSHQKMNLCQSVIRENIDILIYNYEDKEIKNLNKLKKTKVIYYNHSSFLYWLYQRYIYKFKDTVYQMYKNCKYIISLIPIESNYLFKKWGIKSVLLDNPCTYEYDSIQPSNLTNKNIIMIGRANDPVKRYELGIKAMETIIEEIPSCEMYIISSYNNNFKNLINNLKLQKSVKFTGYHEKIDIYLKNASLHILSSISETYPMALSEAKIFGIPTIICGLDYLALAKEGTVIIYDDNPESIGKEAIKILKDDEYRKKLGREARKSMKNRKNKYIAKIWVKLLLSIYKGDDKFYEKLSNENKITEEEANLILNNQLNILKKRNNRFRNLTLEQFTSYQFS